MINDETTYTTHPRMAYDVFVQLAPFGKTTLATRKITRAKKQDILADEYMSTDYFIRLLAQSTALEAFINCNFLDENVYEKMDTIIERAFLLFNTDDFLLSTSEESVKRLQSNIIGNFKNLRAQLHKAKPSYPTNTDEFENACEFFISTMDKGFAVIENLLRNIREDNPLSHTVIEQCLYLIQHEHKIGAIWAYTFFEYIESDANTAHRFALLYPQRARIATQDSPHSSLQTMPEPGISERYIYFIFSSEHFLADSYKKLALQFFHEYISHLVAGIYPEHANTSWKMPIIISEGWMMHAAEIFFMEMGSSLLGKTRHHLYRDIMDELTLWINKIMGRERKTLVSLAKFGRRVATEFLLFLKEHERTKIQANILYYRLSFDLITYYPLSCYPKYKNWHDTFVRTLDSCMRSQREVLRTEIIDNCLKPQKNGDYINLNLLWLFLERSGTLPLEGKGNEDA